MDWITALTNLKAFLEQHEWDIHIGTDDFASLRPVFIIVMGREPNP